MSREEYKDAIEVSVIFHKGQRMFAVPKQPAQQEPVASIFISGIGEREFDDWGIELPMGRNLLYTSPPAQRTWVGLTDEEIDDLSREMVKGNKSVNWLSYSIEAKLRERNT